ncbi:hypothetical protein N0V93_000759 [Gnomoniopsis smithogilvyi]|uniref:Uncharacterized protein n=1 Tax=Gnomoniopsis smithogilvyi TaxID=1191159 RepID=A0A9W8Z499_9PEZI|nr:hypothetical protein N0V93_000759 [Gnomoniopsis smithogilvyi]
MQVSASNTEMCAVIYKITLGHLCASPQPICERFFTLRNASTPRLCLKVCEERGGGALMRPVKTGGDVVVLRQNSTDTCHRSRNSVQHSYYIIMPRSSTPSATVTEDTGTRGSQGTSIPLARYMTERPTTTERLQFTSNSSRSASTARRETKTKLASWDHVWTQASPK